MLIPFGWLKTGDESANPGFGLPAAALASSFQPFPAAEGGFLQRQGSGFAGLADDPPVRRSEF